MKTWLRLAESGALGVSKVVPDRKAIATEGQPAQAAYFLSEGAAEIFHVSEQGFSVMVKLVTAPTVLASPEVLAGEPVYLASIRSAGTSTIHRLRRPQFLQRLNEPNISLEATLDIVLAFLGAARMEVSRLHTTESLLATVLLAYAEVFGTKDSSGCVIGLRRSQSDLAEAIGVAERSVNRIMTRWSSDGVVSKRRGRYILQDIDRLHDFAGDLAGCLVHRWREPS